MNKELPSCSGCEHEYECVNMVCFYELLEKEKKKIRADAIDEFENKISYSSYNRQIQMISLEMLWTILEQLKEKKND